MSIKLMTHVWDDADVRGSELLVLLAIADHANDDGVCWPSLPRLAKRTRLSVRQTQRVIQKLVDGNHIEVISRGDGRGNSTVYRLLIKVDKRAKKGDKLSTLPDAIKVDICDIKVDICDIKGDITMSTEPSIEPSIEPSVVFPATQGETPHQKLFEAVCEAVGWDYNVISKSDKAQVGQLCSVLVKNNYTVEDIRTFITRFWFKDWRWEKNKQHPTLKQLRQEIGKIRSVVADAAPTKVNETTEMFRKYMEKEMNHGR